MIFFGSKLNAIFLGITLKYPENFSMAGWVSGISDNTLIEMKLGVRPPKM